MNKQLSGGIMCNRSNKGKFLYRAILLSIFSFFLTINILTPYMGEDFALMPYYPSTDVKSLAEAVDMIGNRIFNQMTWWNVRVGEQLSIVFGGMDKTVFNILNSIMALYFIFLVRIYALKKNTEAKISSTILTFCMIIIFQPSFGEIFFWQTGSTNYLWALCLLLTFILPIRLYIGDEKIDIIGKSRVRTFILTFVGFIAGVTNENTVGAFWILYIIVIIYNKIKINKTPLWIFMSFVSYTLGLAFMLTAPSTKIRMQYYKQAYNIENIGFGDYILRAKDVVIQYCKFHYGYIALMIILITFGLVYRINSGKSFFENKDFDLLILFVVGVISSGALVLSPYIEIRAFLLLDFMILVNLVYFARKIDRIIYDKFDNNILVITRTIVLMSMLILTIGIVKKMYSTYKDYYEFCQRRDYCISTSNNKAEFWGGYYGNWNSRYLNTREDYLMGNDKYLDEFYDKDIVVNEYTGVYDLGIIDYEQQDVMGNIECISEDNDYIYISGWVAFCESHVNNSDEIEVYIENQCNNNKRYYKATSTSRSDVSEALKSNDYLETGFSNYIPKQDIGNVRIIIVNRKSRIFGELEGLGE